MLMNAERSGLLVIDVQERLLPHIADWQRLLANIEWLVDVAAKIGVLVAAMEQYPKGLGHTDAGLAARLPAGCVGEKTHFSCVAGGCLAGLPGTDRPQAVVCGIESHVCVLQTVLELRLQGKEVFVVGDAVGSREPADKALALERMRQHGIQVVSREMVAFEWLGQAGTPLFREVSREFLR
ncbi:MAG TPA: isochorismatase family protein [Rhodocyclaceae bacterium]|nr:isochorismatase family protein [Rhodocyclaceae bacterium]